MEYILITNNPDIAKYAQDSGVHRIMVDLEIRGKKERQGHLDTVISHHNLHDIENIRKVIDISKLMVRVNPIDDNSEYEINNVISLGADIIMLPMFKTKKEVEIYISCINKRAVSNLLLETPQALVRIDEILQINGIDEIHIGLNDLHLGMGLTFMFELLSGGIVEYLATKFNRKGIKFGIGGIARLGKGIIDSSLILSEHHRLNSKIVILSRDFSGCAETYKQFKERINLKEEVIKLNDYYKFLNKISKNDLEKNKISLMKFVQEFINT